jgi:hypothetical protein
VSQTATQNDRKPSRVAGGKQQNPDQSERILATLAISPRMGGDELAERLWPGLGRRFPEDLAPLADELIE